MTPGRFAKREVALVACAVFALLMLFANGYGYHRDELYFMEAGRHPAWGYDDQPPLTPLIARASTLVFGATPAGLRVPAALALAGCVVLAALSARELGGGRRAQVAAALALATSAALYLGHLVSTSTFDFLFWTLLLYLMVRILVRGEPRLWIVFGVVLGAGLENKWLPALLIAALVIGAAATGKLAVFRSRWVIVGALAAAAIWAPNLIWQADHGWPQRTLARQIAGEDPVGARIRFLPFQLLIVSPLLVYVWVDGLRWLIRAPRVRMLAVAYLGLLALCLASGAKEYYAVGFYPLLLAAGGVSLEERLGRPRARRRFAACAAVSAVVSIAIGLPLIPQSSLGGSPVASLNGDVLETVGWPRFAGAVAGVWRQLPPERRAGAVIFTSNYGEAGAIERYGPDLGLPRAYSGHNSFADFGRPVARAGPVVLVGFSDAGYRNRFFRDCRLAMRFDNRLGIDNEEQGAPIHVCAGPRQAWSAEWPALHHLDA